MTRTLDVVGALGLMALAACKCSSGADDPEASGPLPADRGLRSPAAFAELEGDRERSIALFREVGKVVLHPRCVNCHPAGNRPHQGEEGLPHQPLVVRGDDGRGAPGMRCTTCHGDASYRNVPGSPAWHLAPREMAWEGKSLGAICEQITDPARNGGKSLEELAHHRAEDELVAYGGEPPDHLEPVPGNQPLFAQLVRAWIDAGAHCPDA